MIGMYIGIRVVHNWLIAATAHLLGILYIVIRVPLPFPYERWLNALSLSFLLAVIFYSEEILTKKLFYQMNSTKKVFLSVLSKTFVGEEGLARTV
jgi:hypothetical protein